MGDMPAGMPLPTQPGYQPLPLHLLTEHLGQFVPPSFDNGWEPRDRDAEREPILKWDSKSPATTLKPWLQTGAKFGKSFGI